MLIFLNSLKKSEAILKSYFLIIIFFLFSPEVKSQNKIQLSEQSSISLLTMGPDESELYAVFGHTLIRIKDPIHGFDWVYNFGLFDFNRPNFYLNFARGFLLYEVGKSDFDRMYKFYTNVVNRDISSLSFNFTIVERQALFDDLEEYILPENKTYSYDYFYNNCSTMVRDLLESTMKKHFGYKIVLKKKPYEIGDTFGGLVRKNTTQLLWGRLGIDVALGKRMDKKISTREYTFLPSFLEKYLSFAYIMPENKKLTSEIKFLYKRTPPKFPHSYFTPNKVFWGSLLFVLVLTFFEKKRKTHFKYFDLILFSLIGLFGTFLLSIWLFTNHEASKYNLDIAWVLPLHLLTAGLIFKQTKIHGWKKTYFYFLSIFNLLFILFWSFLPQYLDRSFIPLVLLILIRIVSFLYFKQKYK